MTSDPVQLPASFRDPSGFVYETGGVIYRQVNALYRPHFDAFIASGLYAALVRKGMARPARRDGSPSPARIARSGLSVCRTFRTHTNGASDS